MAQSKRSVQFINFVYIRLRQPLLYLHCSQHHPLHHIVHLQWGTYIIYKVLHFCHICHPRTLLVSHLKITNFYTIWVFNNLHHFTSLYIHNHKEYLKPKKKYYFNNHIIYHWCVLHHICLFSGAANIHLMTNIFWHTCLLQFKSTALCRCYYTSKYDSNYLGNIILCSQIFCLFN